MSWSRYVHANYRFIVDPRGDYRAQSVDADVYLDWNLIMQVLASPISQSAACPICLSDPVAPRMAKCGHVFCLHCLIRFMHVSDGDGLPDRRPRWKSCPICWDSVYISETRPVRWFTGQEQQAPHEDGDIVLRLVVRPAGSTLALPKEGSTTLDKEECIPWHFAADVMDFARVMKGTSKYMTEQFDREIEELEQLEKHDELMFGEDPEWTSKAIRAVNEARDRLKDIGNASKLPNRLEESSPKKVPGPDASASDRDNSDEKHDGEEVPESWMDTMTITIRKNTPAPPAANPSTSEFPSRTSALSTSLAQLRSSQGHAAPSSGYYFYQALLHYYLSPLDIRILKAAFGDYSLFPSTILPRVERVSTGHVVDDDLRKRTKYLAHLPHGCEVSFLECDWTDTVSAEVLAKFNSEIERRRKKNHEKDVREEKDRIRAEREEDEKRYAAARRRPLNTREERFRPEDFQHLATPEREDEGIHGLESTSPVWNVRKAQGSAFASLASPSTSPDESRTVWGTTAVAPTSPVLPPVKHDENPPDDGWLQGWEHDLLAETDLATQVEGVSLGSGSGSGSSKASKKKKGKKITLMSTNVRRGQM